MPFQEAGYNENYSEDDETQSDSVAAQAHAAQDDSFVPRPRNMGVESDPKKRRLSNDSVKYQQQKSPLRTEKQPQPLLSVAPAIRPLPEASWINAEPFDEFIREISEFILEVSKGQKNVEIEAKVGVLIDKKTNMRVQFPVMSEIILAPNYQEIRFESNMSLEQHAHYNRILNERVATTNTSSYKHSRIGYSHTKAIDSFHTGVSQEKIRVTTDAKSGAVKECVAKTRLADLNVYSPKRKVDWRVSVNIEEPMPPPNTPVSHTRSKDRMTYTHQGFQIDLTQVASSDPGSQLQHELEVEFRDSDELMRLGALRLQGHEGGWAFDELVRVFVNNIRILVRNAL